MYKNRIGKKCYRVTYLPVNGAVKIPFWPPYTLYVVAYTYVAAVMEANKRLCRAYPEGFDIAEVVETGY